MVAQLLAHPLRIGLSMHADVALRDQSGAVLATVAQEKPVLTTQAYAKQLADADALIQKIVRENLAQGHG